MTNPAESFPCSQCNGRDWTFTRPGWVEGTVHWFNDGGRWRQPVRSCASCGGVSSGVVFYGRPRRWWRTAFNLVRVVRNRRTITFVPRFYALVALVGLALGVLCRLAFGWPWWPFPLVALVAAELYGLGTAFWGRMANRGALMDDLIRTLHPEQGWELTGRRVVARFLAEPFPVYGLPSWEGTRKVCGWGEGNEGVTSLTLGYGNLESDTGPCLRVEVNDDETDRVLGPETFKQSLAENMWIEAQPEDPDDPWARHTAAKARPPAAWNHRVIIVGGEPRSFDYRAEGDRWTAIGLVHGRLVTVEGRHVPIEDLELVKVTDLDQWAVG